MCLLRKKGLKEEHWYGQIVCPKCEQGAYYDNEYPWCVHVSSRHVLGGIVVHEKCDLGTRELRAEALKRVMATGKKLDFWSERR
jgi:hypothetical protein